MGVLKAALYAEADQHRVKFSLESLKKDVEAFNSDYQKRLKKKVPNFMGSNEPYFKSIEANIIEAYDCQAGIADEPTRLLVISLLCFQSLEEEQVACVVECDADDGIYYLGDKVKTKLDDGTGKLLFMWEGLDELMYSDHVPSLLAIMISEQFFPHTGRDYFRQAQKVEPKAP